MERLCCYKGIIGEIMEKNLSSLGLIHSTESFGSVDGPGVRFVVFMQGCKMRCKYCHNPDTWFSDKGEWTTSDDLLNKALRYKSYWKSNGGITVSGGEPLLQIDFLIDFLKKAKEQNIHTVIDTSGNPFTKSEPFISKFNELLKYTDLFLLDLKHIDNEHHKKLTAQENTNILEMAEYLSQVNKPVWIRHVLVPNFTDDDNYLKKLRSFIDTLSNVEKVEILPYHSFGEYKWQELNINYPLKGVPSPTEERIENAKQILGCD